MSQPQRVTNEQIVAAYRNTGSVWKAAKELGIVGQSVWERLRALGYPMAARRWTAEELQELRHLAETCSAAEIAQRLGRPFAGVACKLSELGIFVRRTKQGRMFPALKRGSGITQDLARKWARDILRWGGSLKQFAVSRGVRLEAVVQALQKHYPDVWAQVTPRLDVPPRPCPQCGADFIPATSKQKTCSRACTTALRTDANYFGGKRSQTVGLAEGICQLCLREVKKGLSSHHLLGKENDPDNELLVALCAGCHHIVGSLGGRTFVDSEAGWQRLIEFVLARRIGNIRDRAVGFHACVDIEWLSPEDLEDMVDESRIA